MIKIMLPVSVLFRKAPHKLLGLSTLKQHVCVCKCKMTEENQVTVPNGGSQGESRVIRVVLP